MVSAAYNDRVCTPEQTLETIGPHLARYGITRLARQTSLDIVGIPVFAAIRPNALTLATSQGKGLTDAAARASAAMEALEYAIAERPERQSLRATANALLEQGKRLYQSTNSLPLSADFPLERPIDWLEGWSVLDGHAIWVPSDLVALRGAANDLCGVCQHTNGLASGNCRDEALFHALCELVERDAGSLWSLRGTQYQTDRLVLPEAFADAEVTRLSSAIAAAGLALRLYDQTTDLAIPTILAEIGPYGQHAAHLHERSSGAGTHPVAARAAIRAITEAAQSRVTAIAAARDDMTATLYEAATLPQALPQGAMRPAPPGLPLGTPLDSLLAHMCSTLRACGVDRLVAVPLGGEDAGVVVLKVLSDQLEDVGVNLHWRPGLRALACLAEMAA